MHRYLIHGLTVASEYELDAHPADGVGGPPDYEIRSGETRTVGGRPGEPGTIAAELVRGGSAEWLLERPDGSWLLRYAATADFEIDRSARRIASHLAPQVPEGLAPILASGSVLSYLAGRDRLVLHAATVEVAGRAVAVVGDSGAGKSTTAAHLCLAGARLLADDTLVVSFSGPAGSAPPRAHRGSRMIRLRPEGRRRFEAGEPVLEREPTADGRLLLRPTPTPEAEADLAMVVAVEYVDARAPFALELEDEIDAKRSLLTNLRAAGWRDPDHLRRQFELAARLAEEVPGLRATLPDRPASEPLGPELAAAIEARLASLAA